MLPDNPSKFEFSLVCKFRAIAEFYLQLRLYKAMIIQILKFVAVFIALGKWG